MAGTRAITLTPTSTGNRRKQPDRKARPKKRPRSPTNSEKIERLRIQKLQDPPRIVIDCCSSNSIGPLSKSHEGYSAGSIMDKKYVWSTDEELFVLQLLHGNTDEQLRFYKCKKDYYEVVAQKMNDKFGYKVMTDSKVKDKFRDFARRYVEHQKQKISHLPEGCLDTGFKMVEWYIVECGSIFVPRQRTSSVSAASKSKSVSVSKSKSKSMSIEDLSPEELQEVKAAADLVKNHCTAPEMVEYVKLLVCRATRVGFSVYDDIPRKKKYLDDLLKHQGQKRKSLD